MKRFQCQPVRSNRSSTCFQTATRGSPANQTVRCRISRARFWAFTCIFSRERRPAKKSSLNTWPSARRAKRVSARLAGPIEIDIRRASRVAGARVRSAPRAPALAFLNPRREKNKQRTRRRRRHAVSHIRLSSTLVSIRPRPRDERQGRLRRRGSAVVTQAHEGTPSTSRLRSGGIAPFDTGKKTPLEIPRSPTVPTSFGAQLVSVPRFFSGVARGGRDAHARASSRARPRGDAREVSATRAHPSPDARFARAPEPPPRPPSPRLPRGTLEARKEIFSSMKRPSRDSANAVRLRHQPVVHTNAPNGFFERRRATWNDERRRTDASLPRRAVRFAHRIHRSASRETTARNPA